MSDKTIPATIKNHRYGEIWGKIWNEVNIVDGIVTIVWCGKRGKGKSMSCFEAARLLDRGQDDVSRFKPTDIKFVPGEFLRGLTGKYPRGKVHVLDDAGLHLYKSDALKEILKNVSKVLQNIRYKHPIIMMNLPHFEQLMKDARTMTDIYIEMHKIDRKRKVALGSIQILKVSSFSGELYRYGISQKEEKINSELGITVEHWKPKAFMFDKPPKDFVKAYKLVEHKEKDAINQRIISKVDADQEAEYGARNASRFTFPQAVDYVKNRLDEVKGKNGKISVSKIMLLINEQGNTLFGENMAHRIKGAMS